MEDGLMELFESWMASSNYPEIAAIALEKLPDGNYRSQLTHAAWQGWKGRGTLLKYREADMDYLMQFFAYEHLPEHLQRISRPFGELAKLIAETLPSNPERTAGLRKLLEAKDCAVRAALFK
jgi:hypothetical protein